MKCNLHPTYKGLRKPRAEHCKKCHRIYQAKQKFSENGFVVDNNGFRIGSRKCDCGCQDNRV